MSGLSRTPGKRVRVNTLRGFESRPLRQKHEGPHQRALLFLARGGIENPRRGFGQHGRGTAAMDGGAGPDGTTSG